MKTLFLFTLLFTNIFTINAQIICQFDWDSNPVTVATIGVNAIGVSGSAVSDAGGVGGTNGLNANLSGTPKLNIDFTFVGSPTFDVPGIDFSIDYHREEGLANFVNRGSSLVIGAGSQFKVSYRVDDGAGGFNTVSSGSVYPIPFDDIYRNYRFYYLPSSGEGFLLVDGIQVWTNDGPDNRSMYWAGSGNLVIGANLDGSGNNDTHLDNLIIGSIINSPLPVSLLNFSVKPVQKTVLLQWETLSETNNDNFEIQKSEDAINWVRVGIVKGAGNSFQRIQYRFTDQFPYAGTSYYQLLQKDFDGQSAIYGPLTVQFIDYHPSFNGLIVYPSIANQFISVYSSGSQKPYLFIYSSNGTLVKQVNYSDYEDAIKQVDISDLSQGVYFISNGRESSRFIKE